MLLELEEATCKVERAQISLVQALIEPFGVQGNAKS